MSIKRRTKPLHAGIAATTTLPTGTSVGVAGVFLVPPNIKELALHAWLQSSSGGDVDVRVYVLPADADETETESWYLDSVFSLDNLELETDYRYLEILTDPWLYKAVFLHFIVNAGTVEAHCNAIYTVEG